MGIIKVLKRKDGATLVVGVALAFVVANFLMSVTGQLSAKITDAAGSTPGLASTDGWQTAYLLPIVTLILELIALELLVWIYVWIHGAVTNKK